LLVYRRPHLFVFTRDTVEEEDANTCIQTGDMEQKGTKHSSKVKTVSS